MTVAQRICGAQTFGDPAFPERDRVGDRVAVCQRAGDRGGQGIAGAVVVSGVDAGGVELEEIGAVEQQIGTVRRRAQMPALDERPLRAQCVKPAGGLTLRCVVDDVDVDEQADLIEIVSRAWRAEIAGS